MAESFTESSDSNGREEYSVFRPSELDTSLAAGGVLGHNICLNSTPNESKRNDHSAWYCLDRKSIVKDGRRSRDPLQHELWLGSPRRTRMCSLLAPRLFFPPRITLPPYPISKVSLSRRSRERSPAVDGASPSMGLAREFPFFRTLSTQTTSAHDSLRYRLRSRSVLPTLPTP